MLVKMRYNFNKLLPKRLFSQQSVHKWKKPIGFDSGVSVYNFLEKEKVPLILKNKRVAKWYMCGPTVYDSAHIGHACSYIRFDIIRRILSGFFDINVISVMGITDIDDKIITRAQGSSQFSDWKELVMFYEQEFHSEMRMLNVLPPFLYCRVTDHIPKIIEFINKIISQELGYLAEGSVYFDTLKYQKYGKFGKVDEHSSHSVKKSSLDFALWKASKPGEPFWESPWGPGRPGWHIECSTMGSLILGDNIDIHSGGLDLMFPHHENEEAQSCCHHGTDQWVNYWLHSGLLHLEDIKMSKSLKNTITIKELLEQYTANQFRLLCLHTHYRSPIEFSHQQMQKAVALLKKFEYFQSDCKNYLAGKFACRGIDETHVYSKLIKAEESIHNALANDFGTPKVIDELSELVGTIHKMVDPNQKQDIQANSVARSPVCIAATSEYVSKILITLGIAPSSEAAGNSDKLSEVVDTLVKFRHLVRSKALNLNPKEKELLGACDDVRKNLAGCGFKIKDYKDNSTWTSADG